MLTPPLQDGGRAHPGLRLSSSRLPEGQREHLGVVIDAVDSQRSWHHPVGLEAEAAVEAARVLVADVDVQFELVDLAPGMLDDVCEQCSGQARPALGLAHVLPQTIATCRRFRCG